MSRAPASAGVCFTLYMQMPILLFGKRQIARLGRRPDVSGYEFGSGKDEKSYDDHSVNNGVKTGTNPSKIIHNHNVIIVETDGEEKP